MKKAIYYLENKEACIAQSRKNHLRRMKSEPWYRVYRCMYRRCQKDGHYFKRGIRVDMKVADVKFLWIRDKAHLLKKASIDRIDSSKNYSIENCRFIELEENKKRGRIRQAYEHKKDREMYGNDYQSKEEERSA